MRNIRQHFSLLLSLLFLKLYTFKTDSYNERSLVQLLLIGFCCFYFTCHQPHI